jgi:hypothetical protein
LLKDTIAANTVSPLVLLGWLGRMLVLASCRGLFCAAAFAGAAGQSMIPLDSRWVLLYSANISGGRLNLNPPQPSVGGIAWLNTTVAVGNFVGSLDFLITDPSYPVSNDGLCLAIQVRRISR